jgi:hypothetical protein
VNPKALTFGHQTGGARPPDQNITLGTIGSALNFNASAAAQSGNWLSIRPLSGATPATLSVTADPRGLAPGTYTGAVTISATGASNSPQVVPVTLVVTAQPPNLKLRFTFDVIDKHMSGPNVMALSGKGHFGRKKLQGNGKFTEFSSANREKAIVRRGEWKATNLVSFTPTTPMTSGENAAGILVIQVMLKPEGEGAGGREIPATLKIVANVPSARLFTGEPAGVTLAITGGATYAPTGAGSVAITIMGERDIDNMAEQAQEDADGEAQGDLDEGGDGQDP